MDYLLGKDVQVPHLFTGVAKVYRGRESRRKSNENMMKQTETKEVKVRYYQPLSLISFFPFSFF